MSVASSGSSALWVSLVHIASLLMVLAIPAGVILIIVGLVRYFRVDPEPDAEEILARRYASGEITLSEYEEMLRSLRGEDR